MLTASKGFTHGVVKRPDTGLAPAEVAMTQLGQQSGQFTVTCTQEPADINPDNLRNYDLVMFYTTGDLGISQENIDYFLNDWLQQKGHGFIGVHSASDTYLDYEPYWEMLGGTFNGHPWTSKGKVTISVHDTAHPGSRAFGDEFSIVDEIYQYKNWQPGKVRVLMSLNMARCDVKKPYHVPVAWVKQYGQGRVYYTNLGHNPQTWTNRQFLDSLQGAIGWIMRQEPGSAAPNPELSKAQEKKAQADAGK